MMQRTTRPGMRKCVGHAMRSAGTESTKTELTVDEYMAGLGVHMLHAGGRARTRELAELCHLAQGTRILDVGCGNGTTACYLAKEYCCRVVGLDISTRMIEGAVKRATAGNPAVAPEFQLSDAERLPFVDAVFDAVFSEGSTVFVEKATALSEYVRVTRPGGYVGLNELSWRRRPTEELLERTFTDLQGVRPLECEEWPKLLADSGLAEVKSRCFSYRSTSWSTLESLGIGALVRVGFRYLTDSRMRNWINRQEKLFGDYSDYWGYGLYVGRRPPGNETEHGTACANKP